MTSYDERGWRVHRVEAGCRAAEDLVAGKRAAVIGYYVVAAIGFMMVVFAASEVFAELVLLRWVLGGLGGFGVGFGLSMVGRIHGCQQIVHRWRESLEDPMPTDGVSAQE